MYVTLYFIEDGDKSKQRALEDVHRELIHEWVASGHIDSVSKNDHVVHHRTAFDRDDVEEPAEHIQGHPDEERAGWVVEVSAHVKPGDTWFPEVEA